MWPKYQNETSKLHQKVYYGHLILLWICKCLEGKSALFLKNSIFIILFFWCLYSFWKDLSREYLVVPEFLMEVPKFKENVLICVITIKKVRDFYTLFYK